MKAFLAIWSFPQELFLIFRNVKNIDCQRQADNIISMLDTAHPFTKRQRYKASNLLSKAGHEMPAVKVGQFFISSTYFFLLLTHIQLSETVQMAVNVMTQ